MNFANKYVVQFYRHSKVSVYTLVLRDTPAETHKTHEYFWEKLNSLVDGQCHRIANIHNSFFLHKRYVSVVMLRRNLIASKPQSTK